MNDTLVRSPIRTTNKRTQMYASEPGLVVQLSEAWY